MELGKRVSKAPVRLVEDPNFGSKDKSDKPDKPDKPANKRQPRKQPQKPAEAPPSRTKIPSKVPDAPAKTKTTKRRVLNLDLPVNPPNDAIKVIEDWAEPSNPFWKDNFHTPDDNTTHISELGCAHREHYVCTPCTLCTLCTPCAHRPSDSLRPKLRF